MKNLLLKNKKRTLFILFTIFIILLETILLTTIKFNWFLLIPIVIWAFTFDIIIMVKSFKFWRKIYKKIGKLCDE